MYARNVTMHLKANTAGEFTQTLEKDVLPLLRKQNGFRDEISFVAADRSEAVAISLWDRKENADSYSRDIYPQVLKSLTKVLEGTPQAQSALRGKESVTLDGTLDYQACDDKICFNPESVPLSWTFTLRPIVLERPVRPQ